MIVVGPYDSSPTSPVFAHALFCVIRTLVERCGTRAFNATVHVRAEAASSEVGVVVSESIELVRHCALGDTRRGCQRDAHGGVLR